METILIVENDPGAQGLAKRILRRYANVEVASTGEEAIGMVLSQYHEYSFVLLDVSLPRMSGWEVAKTLRNEFGYANPIIFMSFLADDPDFVQRCLASGGQAVIPKPMDLNAFKRELEAVILPQLPLPSNERSEHNTGEFETEWKESSSARKLRDNLDFIKKVDQTLDELEEKGERSRKRWQTMISAG